MKLAKKRESLESLVERTSKAIVMIKTPTSSGSGTIVDPRGLILTNRHVVGTEQVVSVLLYNNIELRGKVLLSNRKYDYAFLVVNYEALLKGKPVFLEPAFSFNVKAGESVIALGYPLGLASVVSQGIVGNPSLELGGVFYIQLTAPLNPGSSGGPLVTDDGKFIGINTSKLRAENYGFALPVGCVEQEYRSLLKLKLNVLINKLFYCPVCGAMLTEKSRFCPYDGYMIPEIKERWKSYKKLESGPTQPPGGEIECPVCHNRFSPEGKKYCPYCGVALFKEEK